jgi:hypothetical protein
MKYCLKCTKRNIAAVEPHVRPLYHDICLCAICEDALAVCNKVCPKNSDKSIRLIYRWDVYIVVARRRAIDCEQSICRNTYVVIRLTIEWKHEWDIDVDGIVIPVNINHASIVM